MTINANDADKIHHEIIKEAGIQCSRDAPRHYEISKEERSCSELSNPEQTKKNPYNRQRGLFTMSRGFNSVFENRLPQPKICSSVVLCVNRVPQEIQSVSESLLDTFHSSSQKENYAIESDTITNSGKDNCDPLLKFATDMHQRYNHMNSGFEELRSRVSTMKSALQGKFLRRNEFNSKNIVEGVVLIGRWNTETNEIDSVGTGFVVDKSNGLIATAAHIFYDLHFNKTGERQFGTPIVGIHSKNCKRAAFTYCAEIQVQDISRADACILCLTQKFEQPMVLSGTRFQKVQTAIDLKSCRNENLQDLSLTKECELLEDFSLIAFNQSGEDIFANPIHHHHVNHYVSVYRGYVTRLVNKNYTKRKQTTFLPKSEIAIECVTYDGCSGGPCVDTTTGKVIGMLSRTDRNKQKISYLVPSGELKRLLKLC